MFIENLGQQVKKIVPEPVFQFLKKIATVITAPAIYFYYTGHFLTTILGKPVDRKRRPCLWYSQSIVDFLNTVDFQKKSILEFGAGHSTLWWSEHSESVVAFEDNKNWYDYLSGKISGNVDLKYVEEDKHDPLEIIDNRKFDLIIVDCDHGWLDRVKCAEWSLLLKKEHGAIIIDNSENIEWSAPIMDIFRTNGYSRVDFYGIASGKYRPQCASVFFNDKCFIWEGRSNPVTVI